MRLLDQWSALDVAVPVRPFGRFDGRCFDGKVMEICSVTSQAVNLWKKAPLLMYKDCTLMEWSLATLGLWYAKSSTKVLAIDGDIRTGSYVSSQSYVIDPLVDEFLIAEASKQELAWKEMMLEPVASTPLISASIAPLMAVQEVDMVYGDDHFSKPLITDIPMSDSMELVRYSAVFSAVVAQPEEEPMPELVAPLPDNALLQVVDKTSYGTYVSPVSFVDANRSTFAPRVAWIKATFRLMAMTGRSWDLIIAPGDGLGVVASAGNPWNAEVVSSDLNSVKDGIVKESALETVVRMSHYALDHRKKNVLVVLVQVMAHLPYIVDIFRRSMKCNVLVYDTSASFLGKKELLEIAPAVFTDFFLPVMPSLKGREPKLWWTEKLMALNLVYYMNSRFEDYLAYFQHMRTTAHYYDLRMQHPKSKGICACYNTAEILSAILLGHKPFDMRLGVYHHDVDYYLLEADDVPCTVPKESIIVTKRRVAPIRDAYVEKVGEFYLIMPAFSGTMRTSYQVVFMDESFMPIVKFSRRSTMMRGDKTYQLLPINSTIQPSHIESPKTVGFPWSRIIKELKEAAKPLRWPAAVTFGAQLSLISWQFKMEPFVPSDSYFRTIGLDALHDLVVGAADECPSIGDIPDSDYQITFAQVISEYSWVSFCYPLIYVDASKRE
jgi:hypothetical protein